MLVEAGSGDRRQHRLTPSTHRRDKNIPKLTGAVSMQLIHQGAVWVQTIKGLGIRAQRQELVGGAFDKQPIAVVLEEPLQPWGELAHQLGIAVRDLGLVQLGGAGVNFRAWLAIEGGKVQADTAERGALAVLAGNLFVPLAKPPSAILPPPAELNSPPKHLPGFKGYRLACQLTTDVP